MYALNVIQAPNGRYVFVGSVPVELGYTAPATKSDVLGRRSFHDDAGDLVTMKFPSFTTAAAAIEHAAQHGFTAKVPVKA